MSIAVLDTLSTAADTVLVMLPLCQIHCLYYLLVNDRGGYTSQGYLAVLLPVLLSYFR